MSFLNDGYQTLIVVTVPGGQTVYFKEKEVTPPDLDARGGIDTTTMRNTLFITKQPKYLITLGEVTTIVSYNSAFYNSGVWVSVLGVNASIGIRFPDLSVLTFYGWVDSFKPQSLKEGEFPLAELKIICSNQTSAGVESYPTYTAV